MAQSCMGGGGGSSIIIPFGEARTREGINMCWSSVCSGNAHIHYPLSTVHISVHSSKLKNPEVKKVCIIRK